MIAALMILALLAGIVGLLMASQATMGVAVIGFGCLLGIVARLVQADKQHRETRRDDLSKVR